MDLNEKEKGNNIGRPRIYLETTMFNYFFDEERGEAHRYTVRLFEMIEREMFKAYTSRYVTKELKEAEEPKCSRMMELIDTYGITILDEGDEIERMGRLYIERGIIPKKFPADARHIAIATVNGLDIIVSMNLKHIVKRKTIEMTGPINIENGYDVIKIRSPKEVVENA